MKSARPGRGAKRQATQLLGGIPELRLQMPKRAARIGRWSAGGFELPLDASADLLLGTNNPPDAPAES
ncbi:MAG: hypothetical protein ACKVJX_25485, partial [Verrucomicrobiia bacterium]